jgi:hypothetical protein
VKNKKRNPSVYVNYNRNYLLTNKDFENIYISDDVLKEFYSDIDTENLLYLLNLVRGEMSRLRLEEVELLDFVENTDDADRAILEMLEKFDTK